MKIDTVDLLLSLGHAQLPAANDPTPDWTQDAACLDDYAVFDTVMEFPEGNTDGAHQTRRVAVTQARSACDDCPVRRICLQAGLDSRGWGMWGGFELHAGTPRLRDHDELAAYLAGDGAEDTDHTEPGVHADVARVA